MLDHSKLSVYMDHLVLDMLNLMKALLLLYIIFYLANNVIS